MLQRLFSDKILSAVVLLAIGIIGWIFGGFALTIAAIFLIITGIFNIAKKSYDAGVISILIGIGIIAISGFLQGLIKMASIVCIVGGIVLLVYFYLTKKPE